MTEEEGAQLLRTLARAIIELGRVGRTGVISLPYPHVVQRALDCIVSICLDRGERPPGSAPELVTWCAQRTPKRWPFPVPADLVRPDSVLVDSDARMPTRTCLELSSGGPEGSPEQQARNLLRHTLNDRWRGRVLRLVPDDDETSDTSPNGDDLHAGILRRGDVDSLAETPAYVLVAPLLAVERGHNILNRDNQAAIGTVYFLIRPNPRPDDIALAIHAVNDWIVRAIDSGEFDAWVRGESSIGEAAREVRRRSRSKWYSVLARSVAWSRLREDRDSVTWDLLVLMWQVIGRLVRGDVHARVVFVDAAFAPNLADGHTLPDTRETSLLHGVLHVLRPYFEHGSDKSEHDRFIVDALYRPLWLALDRCIRQTLERN